MARATGIHKGGYKRAEFDHIGTDSTSCSLTSKRADQPIADSEP